MNSAQPPDPNRSPVPVATIIDEAPLSRYQWRVAGLCLLVGIIDGFENGAIAYVAPALTEDLNIPLTDLGKIFAAGTIGMAVGAMILGNIADFWGRKRAILATWAVYFFNWITWYMFLLWLPTALTESGLDIRQASLVGATMGITALLTFLPGAALIQRFGPRLSMICLFSVGSVLALLLASMGVRWGMITLLVIPFTACVVLPQIALNYFAAELYPTPIRATGLGWAISAGRLGSIIGALIGGTLIAWWGISGYFTVLGGPMLVACLCTLMFFSGNLSGRSKPSVAD